MNVKSTKELRNWIKTQKAGDFDRNTDPDFIGSYLGDPVTGKKGFFKVFHGLKPDIAAYLPSILKIAEDGQAIYEFIQNAVDCDSSQFWIYYDENYFVSINNGHSFRESEIASILNIAQSDKTNLSNEERCDKIGRFGIGFKLVHRLVGENDGTAELTNLENGTYRGPVIFSWSNYNQLKEFTNSSTKVAQVRFDKNASLFERSPWLFKILLTNFPTAPSEVVRDMHDRPFIAFPSGEMDEMKSFLKAKMAQELNNSSLLARGTVFFIKLGKNKFARLKDENKELENGVQYALNILKRLQKVTINETIVTRKLIEFRHFEVEKDTDDYNRINPEYTFCPIKVSIGYHKEIEKIVALKSSPNFFKYFPLGDEVDNLCFVIHSDAFDIESNRRKLHKSDRNIALLQTIKSRLIDELVVFCKKEKASYFPLFLSILLSDCKDNDKIKWINDAFTLPLFEFISSKVPTASNLLLKKENVIIKAFKYNIQLSKVGFAHKDWFKWSNDEYDTVINQAMQKEKLSLEKWFLRTLIVKVDTNEINSYFLEISDEQFLDFVNELRKEELTHELQLKLNSISWIRSVGGLMISYLDIQEGLVWCSRGIDNDIQDIFLLFGKDVVKNHDTAITEYMAKVQGNYYTNPKVILEYLKTEVGYAKFKLLSDNSRFKLLSYLISFAELKSEVLKFPFVINRNNSLGTLPALINNECLILDTDFNEIIPAESEQKYLKEYDFIDYLMQEKSISFYLHSDTTFQKKVIDFIGETCTNFYKALVEIHKNRDAAVTDNALSGCLSATTDNDQSLIWVSNNSVYYLSVFFNFSPSEYETFSKFMNLYGSCTLIDYSGLTYLKQIGKGDSSKNPAELLRNDIEIPNDQFELFLELMAKIGFSKIFQQIYVSQSEQSVLVSQKLNGTAVFNFLVEDKNIIEDLDMLGIVFKPFYSDLKRSTLIESGILDESDFGYYLAKYASHLTINQTKFFFHTDIKTKLQFVKKLETINFSSEKTYTEGEKEIQLFDILNELVDYSNKNKDIPEHLIFAKSIADEMLRFRESVRIDNVPIKLCNFHRDVLVKVANFTLVYKYAASDLEIGNQEHIALYDRFRKTFSLIADEDFNRVFRPYRWKAKEDVFNLLNDTKIKPSIYQGVFLINYCSVNNIKADISHFKVFADFSKEEKFIFMDYIFSEDRRSFEPLKKWPKIETDFDIKRCIKISSLAIDHEKMKPWLTSWIGDDSTKLKFLEDFGLFGTDMIIKLRTKITDGSFGDAESVNLVESCDDKLRLYFTVQWMADNFYVPNSLEQFSFTNKLMLKPYLYFDRNEQAVFLTLDFQGKSYKWTKRGKEGKFFRINNIVPQYLELVQSYLYNNSFYMVDQTTSAEFDKKWEIIEVFPELRKNEEWLLSNTTAPTDSLELEWALSNNLHLRELPPEGGLEDLYFENTIIHQMYNRSTFQYNDIIYFIRKEDKPLLYSIESFLDDKQKIDFYDRFYKKESKKTDKQDDIDMLEKRYSSTFEKAIKDRLDLSKEDQRRNYDSAFEIGCGYLLEDGYTFPDGDEFISAFSIKLINKIGVEESFIFSSAINGLLFLAPLKIDEMNRMNHKLIVIYPGTEIRQFDSVTHLINDPDNKYLLLRTQNTIDVENFMKVVKEKLSDNSHFIFATSDIMRKSLFSIQQGRKGKKNVNDTVKDEDTLLWN